MFFQKRREAPVWALLWLFPSEVAKIMPTCRVAVDDEGKIVNTTQQCIQNILANLGLFVLEDKLVTGVLFFSNDEKTPFGLLFRDGEEAGRVEMMLSELCVLGYSGLAGRLNLDPNKVSLKILIEKDGQVIGRVDDDGIFHYEVAPDLRTALGWYLSTNGGRDCSLNFFNLDEAANRLLNIIRLNGIKKDAFFGAYMDGLRLLIVYKSTSRFAGGYNHAARTLWGVATRELFNNDHPGYPGES